MAALSRYCKAYARDAFATYTAWNPKPAEGEAGDEYYFLHDSYIVTRSIFVDEEIVFDEVRDSWIQFCERGLQFAIPPDDLEPPPPVDSTNVN